MKQSDSGGRILFMFAIALALIGLVGFAVSSPPAEASPPTQVSPETRPSAVSMRDSLYIGEVPAGEDAAQVGADNYANHGRKQCLALIHQLRRMLGNEPSGARLKITDNPHDFGSYYSVDCVYDDSQPAAQAYAFRCESEFPEHWDDAAKTELGLTGSASTA